MLSRTTGNRYYRGLYAFEFEDNSVYVGLTYNYEERHTMHKYHTKSIKKQIESGINYKFITYNEFCDTYKMDIGMSEAHCQDIVVTKDREGRLSYKPCYRIVTEDCVEKKAAAC